MSTDTTKQGLWAGVGAIAYLLLFYVLHKAWMLHPLAYYSSLLIYLFFMYRTAEAVRVKQGGVIGWKEALRPAFTVFLLANVLFYLFYWAMHQLDPDLVEVQREAMRNFLPKITPKDQLEEVLANLEEADLNVTPGRVLFGFARGAIGGFLLAALIAYVVQQRSDQQPTQKSNS